MSQPNTPVTYDPSKHHRRSIRLKDYDYGQPGAYFVTICTHRHVSLFGDVMDGTMCLNGYGRVAETCWKALPVHFSHVLLDTFVVMPNHMHGLIVITSRCENRYAGGVGDGTGKGEASAIRATQVPEAESEMDAAVVPDVSDASPLQAARPTGTHSGSLGAIIQNFKSTATRKINRRRGTPGAPLWQRGYYEHIIRNERALDCIRQYIVENPLRWHFDKNFPQTGR